MKHLLIITLLISCSFSLKSQVEIGVNVGLSSFTVIYKNNYYAYTEFSRGVALAIPIKIHLKRNFIFQPEINYIQKGIGKITYDFIEIPFLFKYQIPFSNKHIIEVGLGLGFGKTIGKNFRREGRPYPYNHISIFGYDGSSIGTGAIPKYKGFDLDAIIDISYQYKLKEKISLVSGFRVQYDFINAFYWTELQKERFEIESGSPLHPEEYNRGAIIYAGINFKIGK